MPRREIALPIEGSSPVARKNAWGQTASPNMGNRIRRRAAFTTSILVLGVASIALPLSAAEGSACVPVRAGSDPSTLPEAWRAAFEALIASTARDGLPWSCPGGSIELALTTATGAGALTVTDAKGRKTTRPVGSPADVGPTGKALLAGPRIEAPVAVVEAPVAAPAPIALASPRPEAPRAMAPADPRLVLTATAGPRVSGPDTTAWMSGTLHGAIPFGAWSLGLWTRFDLPVALERPISPYFSMSSVSVGLSGGRSFAVGSFSLDARLAPSVAVVSMENAKDESLPHPEGARVALRIGAEAGASTHINDWLLGRIAFDGEVAPAKAAMIADGFPQVPRYMLGVSLGLEAVIH
jgi:hypothetical protein